MPAYRLTFVALLLLTIPAAAAEPESEALRWLREYIQIDTTNPPGGERPAAEYLAAILEREGIASRLLESPTGRTSLVARLAAPDSGGRAVALLHHIDVVAADGTWSQPAFSGRRVGGKVWGRGALDVKGLGIAHLSAMLALKREGVPLARDVVFIAVADEEAGGGEGAAWLLEAHGEIFAGVEAVLGEGGSNRVLNDRLIWWGIEVVQKRPLWLAVSARGRGGHASGLNPESATHRLVTALARLVERPLRYRVTDAARMYLGALARLEGGRAEELARDLDEIILEDGPTVPLAPGLPVYFMDTVQVTEIDNGRGSNVIAPLARAYVDMRLLPDTDAEAHLAAVRETLGGEVEVEVLLTSPEVAASPVDHPVFRAFERSLGVRGAVVPTFITGTTDSRFFRQRGIPAYGFSPFAINSGDLRGIHAADERVPVDAFLRGVETMRRMLLACAGPQ